MLKAVAILALFVPQLSVAQSPAINRADVERIVGASMSRNGAMEFLEVLSDRIGGRVTGSPESAATASLILKTLTDAGLTNAHIEQYAIESGWKRGQTTASVISPVSRPIYVGSYGWAPGTNGPVEARLVEVNMSPDGRLDVPVTKLRDAAVMVNIDLGGNSYAYSNNSVVLRAKAIHDLASAGAAAMLIPSDKPHRMLYTSAYGIYPRAGLPVLSVAKEDTEFLRRLMKKEAVQLQLEVHNDFPPVSGGERNVIAEIPGSGKEIVVVGAHFDSWDWAQGANDNGSGVAAVLEAARVLRSMDIKPRATIRFVFFSGEEQGCLGSRSYLDAHETELDRLRMFIMMDGGAQQPLGIGVKGRHDLLQPLATLIEPLRAIGANRLLPDSEVGSDDEPFIALGIPAVELNTEPGDYDTNHHAITDTLDKVDARALSTDTAGMALTALAIANADSAPGRRLQAPEILELLKRTGLLDEARLLRGNSWVPQ
ncbi:MAG: M20/M25/M40 family metallo-hydrolase [Acidobacteriia bacterium]|nr:M20/M25/M40 family metallo-hydrolase [Terriglobia bacterium]